MRIKINQHFYLYREIQLFYREIRHFYREISQYPAGDDSGRNKKSMGSMQSYNTVFSELKNIVAIKIYDKDRGEGL